MGAERSSQSGNGHEDPRSNEIKRGGQGDQVRSKRGLKKPRAGEHHEGGKTVREQDRQRRTRRKEQVC